MVATLKLRTLEAINQYISWASWAIYKLQQRLFRIRFFNGQ